MLILFIFLAELAAAILAFLFREHVSMLHFLPAGHHWMMSLLKCHVMLLMIDTYRTGICDVTW